MNNTKDFWGQVNIRGLLPQFIDIQNRSVLRDTFFHFLKIMRLEQNEFWKFTPPLLPNVA